MRAAIYARKSTKQYGRQSTDRPLPQTDQLGAVGAHSVDDQKSVTRQTEGGHSLAASRGWAVAAQHVYSDDGISGAEFSARPALTQMMAAATRREFDVLIISDSSRLGREQIETAFLLKRLDMCGVKVVTYRDGHELLITTPMDKILRSIRAFADEQEREGARERTHEAMVRKARLGHVTGGRVFGYHNVPVFAPGEAKGSAKPLYKVHEINEARADRKSQARAAEFARGRAIGLLK